MARKTFTSTEVKTRWIKKNYQRYAISFRFDTDQSIIDFVEKHKETYGTTNLFRDALEMYMNAKVLDD